MNWARLVDEMFTASILIVCVAGLFYHVRSMVYEAREIRRVKRIMKDWKKKD